MSENVLPMFSSRSFMVSCPIIVRPFWVYCCALCEVGEGNDTPLQHSCLENPMDGGAWYAAVHGVAKSRTWLSDFTFNRELEYITFKVVRVKLGRKWATSLSLSCIGEGNGNPLQCSCLENPREGGAWWAAVYWGHRVGHDWSDLAWCEV